jgi:lipopolysaccharide export system permease protein
LFFPDLSGAWERANLGKMLAEGHSRIAAALYTLAFMAMALTAVIGGSFSRMGYGARIAAVACAALLVRVAGFSVQAAAGSAPVWNLAQYLIPLGAAVAALCLLFAGARRRPLLAAGAPA